MTATFKVSAETFSSSKTSNTIFQTSEGVEFELPAIGLLFEPQFKYSSCLVAIQVV